MPVKRTYREFKQGLFKPNNQPKCINKTPPEYRSGLELKVMKVLDKNPNVLSWSSEKVIIPYQHPIKSSQSGKPEYARYFVDFYIKLKIGEKVAELLVEVKPENQCHKPKNHGNKKASTLLYENSMYAINCAKWEAAKKYCEKKNYQFIIITEKNIERILGKA
jgi:hypothetical protein